MITDKLKARKSLEQLETIRKIQDAQKAIESEVDGHGYYPSNGGQITLTELYKRAGVGHSTLKNKGHREFLRAVQSWKARIRAKVAVFAHAEKPMARSSKSVSPDKIDALQQLNAFKIIHAEMAKKLMDSEAENARLRKMLRERAPRDAT